MVYKIIANVIALVASLFMIASSYTKDEKKTIIFQTMQMFLFVLSNVILGGIPGAIISGLSGIRNIFTLCNKLTKKVQVVFMLLLIFATIYFNNLGLIGLFPLMGTIIFTIFINNQNPIYFKSALNISIFAWLVYDIYIGSYSSAVFDFISFMAGLLALFRIRKMKKKG